MRIFTTHLWNESKGLFAPGSFEVERGFLSRWQWGPLQKRDSRSKVLDLSPHFIGPSAIDLHVHSRGWDESHKEDFSSLDAASLKGGVSLAACMANTLPRLDTVERIKDFFKFARSCHAEFIPFAAVSLNLEGREATAWDQLLKLPIAGLSDDGRPLADASLMEAALKVCGRYGKVLSLHEEDHSLSNQSLLHESESSMRLGIEGSPSESEWRMVERDLLLAEKLKAPIHFGHLSAAESVQLILKARKRGVSATAELTPHHALLSVDSAEGFPLADLSRFKVCPVIRSKEDQKALIEGVKRGVINCFASDHAPHSILEKDRPYREALHGMIGLEYFFPLYNEVRLRHKLSWTLFYDCLRKTPARILGRRRKEGFAEGFEADFIVFDPDQVQTLSWTLSKSRNSPFEGTRVRGQILQHWIQGKLVYEC